MRVLFSLFPWDVDGDSAAAAGLRSLGVDRVALAATYHAARAATPRHPRHRIVEVGRSASYVSGPSPLPAGAFSYERARADLESAGVAVIPWIVLGHIDYSRPDIPRVVDAFGTELAHAICLRSPEAEEYVEATLDSVAEVAGTGLVVEGAAWSGAHHASVHDKVSAAGLDLEALSWCFCSRCSEAADVDAAEVRAALTADRAVDAAAVARIRLARREAATQLRHRIARKARDANMGRVMFHPDPDEDAPEEFLFADAWAGADPAIERLQRGAARGAYDTILGAEIPDPDNLAERWAAFEAAGCEELLIYHAGLASTTRLNAASTALKGRA